LPNALRALDTLGFADDIRTSGHEVGSVRYFDRRGNLLGELTFPWAGLDEPYVEIRRRALHDVLIEGADVPIRMGTTVTNVARSPDAITVTLSDQTTATYRLVVGAEGVYSMVRALARITRSMRSGSSE
jgi:2-polyprenyl-6-methoxyphenol hydroxylase-like FAD-dependent oxidoreductase